MKQKIQESAIGKEQIRKILAETNDPQILSEEIIQRLATDPNLLNTYLQLIIKRQQNGSLNEKQLATLVKVWHNSVAWLKNNPTLEQFMAKFGHTVTDQEIAILHSLHR